MKKVTIYTDGSYRPSVKAGGWAAVMVYKDGEKEVIKEIFGRDTHGEATSQRMEILAVIMALQHLRVPCKVSVYSDSSYVVNAVNKWMRRWHDNGWQLTGGGAVKNQDLWERLWELMRVHYVTAVYVKGHDGNPYNERCDTLAGRASANAI